ncbi:MAG: hypothetical protein ACYCW6_01830 [Candidatus Xenobia bacterium]
MKISSFVGQVQRGMLRQARLASAGYIGAVGGYAAGSALLGPLAIATAEPSILIGGTIATAALGILAAYHIEEHHLIQHALGQVGSLAGLAARSVSNVLYPSIEGATQAQQALIEQAVDKLPLQDVTAVQEVMVSPGVAKLGDDGICTSMLFENKSYLSPDPLNETELANTTIIHELGHGRDFTQGLGGEVGTLSSHAPWGHAPYFFDPTVDAPGNVYAAKNAAEDFAQSQMAYHLHPDQLAAEAPGKLQAMRELHRPTAVDAVFDRGPVRELGKRAARAMAEVPGLRTAFEVAGAVIGPALVHSGAAKLEGARDAGSRAAAKMRLASGLVSLTRAGAMIGLASSLASWIMLRRLRQGSLQAQRAEQIANGMLAVAAGPLGMAGAAIEGRLRKDGNLADDPGGASAAAPVGKQAKTPAAATLLGAAVGGGGGFAVGGPLGAAVGVGLGACTAGVLLGQADAMQRSFVTVAGSVGGMLAGGAAGAAIGGMPGAVLGAAWGRVSGATLCLTADAAAQALKAWRDGELSGPEVKYLARVTLPPLVAAAAAGLAGAVAGSALGTAVAGPIGGWLLGTVASLGLSALLARTLAD